MAQNFPSIFNLTEEQCIDLLNTPQEQLEDASDRYIAASRLVNFPSPRSVAALIAAVENRTPGQDNRIVRRKSVETLGYFKAAAAQATFATCLNDEDTYTVDNAIWAIGEIGCQDDSTLEAIVSCLEREELNHRGIVQVLAKLNYRAALPTIEQLTDTEDPTLVSAAWSAICQLTGDDAGMTEVVDMLYHPNVNARRGCIQDLIDARYFNAIPDIARAPVSMMFRLRGIRSLAEEGIPSGEISFAELEPHLDATIRDRPDSIQFVHQYDRVPSLEFAIGELYGTDFGRCYLASQTLLDRYAEQAGEALLETYRQKARDDYGAHYHVLKLLGWLRHQPSFDLLVEGLNNPFPQFRKSRFAAAIALGELETPPAIPELKAAIGTDAWELDYACCLALQQLGVDLTFLNKSDRVDFLVEARFLRD